MLTEAVLPPYTTATAQNRGRKALSVRSSRKLQARTDLIPDQGREKGGELASVSRCSVWALPAVLPGKSSQLGTDPQKPSADQVTQPGVKDHGPALLFSFCFLLSR